MKYLIKITEPKKGIHAFSMNGVNSTISHCHHNMASMVKNVEHLLLSDSRDITFLVLNILRKFLAFTFSVNADVHEAIK